MGDDMRYWLLMLILVPLGFVSGTVALCGWITILTPHDQGCPTSAPAHITGSRS